MICGQDGCQAEATHFVALLIPEPGLPFSATRPLFCLASAEGCETHCNMDDFKAYLKEPGGIIEQLQKFLTARREPPLDLSPGRAVVRVIPIAHRDFNQFARAAYSGPYY